MAMAHPGLTTAQLAVIDTNAAKIPLHTRGICHVFWIIRAKIQQMIPPRFIHFA